ncbi:hypothetical protein C2G38_2197529 [Gigaspora rosea]|uniref:Uncharacterized protein n=1 Tax=Gigaspora rosea TaxID=44941 RepID=A0A397V0X7_9GLOM|nr:hypothetical protein C2G38_2197529 [Gigaspora rosea]
MIEDNSEHYHNNFSIKAMGNSVASSEAFCLPEVTKSNQKPKKKYKYKELSFINEYFETIVNKNSEEIQVCKVVIEDAKKCDTDLKIWKVQQEILLRTLETTMKSYKIIENVKKVL